MHIAIFGINYAPELTGAGKYTGELAVALVAAGHKVSVVTAPPYYPGWRRGSGYPPWQYREEFLDGVRVLRCPLYVPGSPSLLKRLLHLFSFGLSALWGAVSVRRDKPDVVLLIQPTLFAAPAALLCSAGRSTTRVMHVQDFELDAMQNLVAEISLLDRIARSAERLLYRRFHAVSTISQGMITVARDKGIDPQRLSLLPNWVDTRAMSPQSGQTVYHEQWQLREDQRVVLYAGNVGAKQGLEFLLAVALRRQTDDRCQFVIVGDGAGVAELKDFAQKESLQNVRFLPLQPAERFPELLATADVHVVCQRRGAADIVLPSKLTGILAVGGHCVVTADSDTELGRLAQEYPGICECVVPESVDALEAGILEVLDADTRSPNLIARQYAEQHLEKSIVLERFCDWLESQALSE